MVFNKTLTVTTLNGDNYNFDDVGLKGAATTAFNQYMAHQTIHSHIRNGNGGYVEVIIPYSSIMNVFVEEEKKDSFIWDKNCSKGSCEGLYFFYSTSGSDTPLEEGAVVDISSSVMVFCSDSPAHGGGEDFLPFSVELSDPNNFTLREADENIYEISVNGSDPAQTEVTLSMSSQGCVRKFTVRAGQ